MSSIRRPNNTSQQVVPGHQADRETDGEARQTGRTDAEAGQTGRTDVLHLIATQIQQREAGERSSSYCSQSLFGGFSGGLRNFSNCMKNMKLVLLRCGKSRQTLENSFRDRVAVKNGTGNNEIFWSAIVELRCSCCCYWDF